MNKPEVISQIKREDLDEKNYFETLIKEAYTKQIISEEDIVNLQIQIIQLLDERVYKYNGIESSSIRKEIMEEINFSNYYTIGLELKTSKKPDEAIKKIKQQGLREIYYNGRKKIDRNLNIIRVMYIKVKKNKLRTKNITYNDTIIGGIRGIFKNI